MSVDLNQRIFVAGHRGMVGSASKKLLNRFSLAAVFQCGHLIPPFSQ